MKMRRVVNVNGPQPTHEADFTLWVTPQTWWRRLLRRPLRTRVTRNDDSQ